MIKQWLFLLKNAVCTNSWPAVLRVGGQLQDAAQSNADIVQVHNEEISIVDGEQGREVASIM